MPLVDAIRNHVFAAERIHADDTTVPVLAKGKRRTGRLWTYVRDDRPFAGPDPPAAVFFYSPDRGGAHPEQHLAGYAGLMQPDAYARFGRLYEANRKGGPIIEAACWAHGRRKFFDLARLSKAPIAAEAVKRIDVLFVIEREINGLAPQERLRVRQERSRPPIVEVEAWLREQRAKLSRNNDTTKAINYCLSRWDAFSRFLDDGRLCMSNNAAERELRAVAVGRRNWTFAGSDEGGRRAAAIYTLIATAKLNDIDPQAWLADVLARLPDHPASASTDSCPGIGDLRTSLRPHKRGQPSPQDDLTRGRHPTRTDRFQQGHEKRATGLRRGLPQGRNRLLCEPGHQNRAGHDRQRFLLQIHRLPQRLQASPPQAHPHQALYAEDHGKAERFIQTSLREWAYARAYNTSDERAAELPRWLHNYNCHRPHGSIGSMPPIRRLALTRNNLLRLHI
ncbi:hypothetical protein ABIA40_000361 [Bradyrhizobium sp. USDA 223]